MRRMTEWLARRSSTPRILGLLVVLLALVLWASGVPVLTFAATPTSTDPTTKTGDPTTKTGAEIAALFHPPAFAHDDVTNLTKNNTSAVCQPGGGNFICAVSYQGQTATVTVAANGTVTP